MCIVGSAHRWGARLLLVSALALVAAAIRADAVIAQGLDCRAGPSEDAVTYDGTRPELLEGRFLLTQITTSWDDEATTNEFSLRVTTPEERANAKRTGLGYFPRNVTHVGRLYVPEEYGPWPIEADGPIIYLGCRDCMDEMSRDVLRIAAVNERGIWGLWNNYQTGIGIVVDSLGHPLPNPAGYFCAERIAE